MRAVWTSGLPPTARLVLLALADWADDAGRCWPSLPQIADKTGFTERTVRTAIAEVEGQWLTREIRHGRGTVYLLRLTPETLSTPERASTPEGDAGGKEMPPRKELPATPERASTNTPINPNPKNKGQARGSRLASDWVPGPLPGNVASLVTLWPHGREDRELDQFRDFWTAKAGADACKLDWDRTWHTWIRRAHDQIMREASYGQSPANRGGQSRRASRSNEMDAAMRDLGFG